MTRNLQSLGQRDSHACVAMQPCSAARCAGVGTSHGAAAASEPRSRSHRQAHHHQLMSAAPTLQSAHAHVAPGPRGDAGIVPAAMVPAVSAAASSGEQRLTAACTAAGSIDSSHLRFLKRTVEHALEPSTAAGAPLARLSLALGLVEEQLVGAVASGSAESVQLPDAAELEHELDLLLGKLEGEIHASIGAERIRTDSPRQVVAAVGNFLWKKQKAKENNNTAHLQTVLSFLRKGELDCFGLATTTLIVTQMLLDTTPGLAATHPLSSLTVQLSEDHCWLSWQQDGESCTGEVAVAKHKITAAAPVTPEGTLSWLYLHGRHVDCQSRERLVFAMIHNINPEVTKKVDSAQLGSLKLALLCWMRERAPTQIYPGAVCEIGDQLDVLAQQRMDQTLIGATTTAEGLSQLHGSGAEAAVEGLLGEREAELVFEHAIAMSEAPPYDGYSVYPHSMLAAWHFRRAKFCGRLLSAMPTGGGCAAGDSETTDLIDSLDRARAVVNAAQRRHALACLRRYAVTSRVISRYTAGKKDDQLVKEVEEAVEKVTLCMGQCDAGMAIQPVCELLDSLCKWEEGGMRLISRWSGRIVTCVMRRCSATDRQWIDCAAGLWRSRKMQRLAEQGLWAKLPRSKATVLLLLDGDAMEEGGESAATTGRSKRQRVGKRQFEA